jgi:hypothetical protein
MTSRFSGGVHEILNKKKRRIILLDPCQDVDKGCDGTSNSVAVIPPSASASSLRLRETGETAISIHFQDRPRPI